MGNNLQPRRRNIVLGLGAAGLASLGAPAIAQQRTKIRMGYVDTLAVTGQLWTGVHRGHWAKEGIEFDPVQVQYRSGTFQRHDWRKPGHVVH